MSRLNEEYHARLISQQIDAGMGRTMGREEVEWWKTRGRYLQAEAVRGNSTAQRVYELEEMEKRILDVEQAGRSRPKDARRPRIERAVLR